MSVSLLLGLIYLISELLLTVTRRSRSRTARHGFFSKWSVALRGCYSPSTRLMHRKRLMMRVVVSFTAGSKTVIIEAAAR